MTITANRGEWSEAYGILLLLVKPDFNIVNSELEIIDNELYRLKEIIVNQKVKMKYKIVGENIVVYADDLEYKKYSKQTIDEVRKKLLKDIKKEHLNNGAFEVKNVSDFLSEFSHNQTLKSPSTHKEDLITFVLNNKLNKDVLLSYSIKSMLGSPATILNASKSTNFEYLVEGLSKDQLNEIQQIEGSDKIKKRINRIIECGGKIKFIQAVNPTFKYNLKMIDSNMDIYIGNTLLQFYKEPVEARNDLKSIFIKANDFQDEIFGAKKLADFLEGSSFGFFPSKIWNGTKTVNGGIMIIDESGEALILDLTYYSDEVRKYLINNTKLDTPSTSRYRQVEFYNRDGNDYFTLNLQVRYKQ